MQRLTITLFTFVLGTALCAPAMALTLYDPSLGTLPQAQGWTTAATGSPGAQSLDSGRLVIDTTGAGVGAFGYGRSTLPDSLDGIAGFRLGFDLKLVSDTHDSPHRAGFSVLVQTQDQSRALELGFWQDRVWALSYVPGSVDSGFVQGEFALLDTQSTARHYTLSVQNDLYVLSADGLSLLSGALRDYPTLGLSTLVYSASNYVFFGDNSTRGAAVAELGALTLAPVPEPATAWLLAAGLALLAGSRRRGRS